MEDKRYSLEELILMGVVEASGVDMETGEILYKFTEAMQEEYPEVQKRWEEAFYREMLFFWQQGLLDMNIMHPNPDVKLTPLAFNEQALNSLSPDRKKMFIAFRELFRKNK